VVKCLKQNQSCVETLSNLSKHFKKLNGKKSYFEFQASGQLQTNSKFFCNKLSKIDLQTVNTKKSCLTVEYLSPPNIFKAP